MTQTKLDLDAIQARADAATPGPWDTGGTSFVHKHPETSVWGPTPKGCQSGHRVADEVLVADAKFIAAARTDVIALVARVRELEAINNTLASAAASAGSRVEELETAIYNHHYNKDISNVTRGGDRHDRMLWEILNLKHS